MLPLLASGLLWAWGHLIHFLASGFFAEGHVAHAGFAESTYLVAAFAGYALAVALAEKGGRRVEAPLSWAGCAAMMAGSLVLALQIADLPVEGVVLQAGSLLAGVGLALCTTVWGVCLARVDFDSLESTALSWCAVFAGVAVVVAVASLSYDVLLPVAVSLLVLLPLGAQIGLARTLAVAAEGNTSEQRDGSDGLGSRGPSRQDAGTFANLFFAFLALSFIWFAVSSLQRSAFGISMILFAVAAVILWAVLWVALRSTRRFGLSTLYRWALPLTVASVACAAFDTDALRVIAFVMVFVVNLGFEVVAKMFFAIIGRHWKGHEALAFAGGVAVINLAGLAGSFLAEHVQASAFQADYVPPMLAALVVFALAVSLALGGSRVSLTGISPEAISEVKAAPREEDAVARFCATLGETYGLTPREAEVVSLLAQGRSRSYVREALYISKGTVDTHAYHAYAKMGIRTRDDLLKLAHGGDEADS